LDGGKYRARVLERVTPIARFTKARRGVVLFVDGRSVRYPNLGEEGRKRKSLSHHREKGKRSSRMARMI